MSKGNQIPGNFEVLELDVMGMECVNCANSIKTYLTKLNGIYKVEINFTSEVAAIEYNPNVITKEDIIGDIRKIGYDVLEDDDEETIELQKKKNLSSARNNIILSFILTVIIAAISMSAHPGMPDTPMLVILLILTSVVVFRNGQKFLTGAWNALRNKTSDMNSLIALGVLSSYIYSLVITFNHLLVLNISVLNSTHEVYFETAAMIITLILTGNYLETVLKSKTQTSIKKLKELQSKFVNVIRSENNIPEEMLIPFKKVRVGDIVIIVSGDKIPVDGHITEGYCVVDESAMTGESSPIEKKQGDSLISGTLIKNGFVKMKAVKVGKDTTLSRIIGLVKEASNSKPKIQRLADKISSVFVPVVVSISVLTFIVWHLILSKPFDVSLLYAVSVLIIACPCALGLASPMAVVIGVGRAAENGILFNNVEAIEKIINIDTVCFDKTGTLTTGEMHLKSIITLNDILQNDLLKYVFSVEKYSNHPIAKSIFNYCVQNNVDIFADVNNINIEDGLGISGIVSGKEVVIGNGDLMTKHGIDCGSYADANKNGNLFIGIDGILSGLIEFEDKIKEEAKEIVSKLKSKNLGIFLISGDGEEVTKSVADKLEIENYTFRTMPEDKEKIISGLQAENKNVAMIGDGINDAPSLARANVGIAVGTGQDIAIDSADVILVKGDLRNLIKSINISSKTVSIIKQNIFWAFFYNILAIPLAAGIFSPWGIIISPVMAAMFMAFSDVITVMINSLRLKYVNIN